MHACAGELRSPAQHLGAGRRARLQAAPKGLGDGPDAFAARGPAAAAHGAAARQVGMRVRGAYGGLQRDAVQAAQPGGVLEQLRARTQTHTVRTEGDAWTGLC